MSRMWNSREFPGGAFSFPTFALPTYRWEGKDVEEKGIDMATGKVIVAVDPRYFRPTEVETLLGSPEKAKQKLGWVPKISVEEMAKEMVEHDLLEARRANALKDVV